MTATSSALDIFDLTEGPLHRRTHICINILQIFHESWLIAVAGEQTGQLSVVHATVNCAFADLEAIDMDDGKYGPRLPRIDIFVRVPCPVTTIKKNMGDEHKEGTLRCSGTSLSLAVPNDGAGN